MRHRIHPRVRLFPLVLCCAATAGCAAGGGRGLPKELRGSATAMDRVEQRLEEFGTMSISSPLLARPDPRFKFQLEQGPNEYFTQAKTEFQGRAAEFEQVIQSLAFGLSFGYDPTIAGQYVAQLGDYYAAKARQAQRQAVTDQQLSLKNRAATTLYEQERRAADQALADAKKEAANEADEAKKAKMLADADSVHAQAIAAAYSKYADAIQAPEAATVPAYPGPATKPAEAAGDLAPGATDARGQVAQGGLLPFQGLLGSTTRPSIPNRSAIITAAGDNVTEAIFDILADPELTLSSRGALSFWAYRPWLSTRAGAPGRVTQRTWP